MDWRRWRSAAQRVEFEFELERGVTTPSTLVDKLFDLDLCEFKAGPDEPGDGHPELLVRGSVVFVHALHL